MNSSDWCDICLEKKHEGKSGGKGCKPHKECGKEDIKKKNLYYEGKVSCMKLTNDDNKVITPQRKREGFCSCCRRACRQITFFSVIDRQLSSGGVLRSAPLHLFSRCRKLHQNLTHHTSQQNCADTKTKSKTAPCIMLRQSKRAYANSQKSITQAAICMH